MHIFTIVGSGLFCQNLLKTFYISHSSNNALIELCNISHTAYSFVYALWEYSKRAYFCSLKAYFGPLGVPPEHLFLFPESLLNNMSSLKCMKSTPNDQK